MIKLFLVDDHKLVLDGIKALLSGQTDLLILGEAGSGDEMFYLLGQKHPDIILMDISLPGISGIALCRQLKEKYPDIKVLFLSMYTNEEFIINAIHAGADGYLPKNISQEELLKAIRTVYAGGDYFSNSVSDIILSSFVRRARNGVNHEPSASLSKRENEILKFVAEGLSNPEIAVRLFISVRTVESHKNHIMQKLNLKTTVELVKYALKNYLPGS